MFGDEPLAGIVFGGHGPRYQLGVGGLVAVEERRPIAGDRPLHRRCRRLAHRRIPVVTGEDLVGALAGLHHLDVFGDLLAEQIEGHAVMADHRFAHGADRAVEGRQHPVGADPDLVMIGVEAFGDDVGVAKLVALDAADGFEADGERLQSVLAGFGEQPDDQAGIHPAGQQASHRDVGDQAPLHRHPQRVQNRVLPVAFGPVGALVTAGEVGLPVDLRGPRAVGLDHHQRGRRQLADAAQDRPWRRHDRMEGHVVVQRDLVDPGVDVSAGQQGGQRRREPDPVGVLADVERFDAQAVAAQQHSTAVAFDDGEGVHAFEVVDELVAPMVVALEQHLGVAVREEPVAVAHQFVAQRLVVVDAAVPGDRQPEFGVDHGLRAGLGEVDDLQSAMPEGDPALGPHAGGVGSARDHDLGHRGDGTDIRGSSVEAYLAGGSTHLFDPTLCRLTSTPLSAALVEAASATEYLP